MIINIEYERAEEQARTRAERMITYGLYNRFNTSVEERLEHAQIGCLGEIAFEKLLIDNNIEYNTDRDDFENRNADEFDFQINGVKLDVKVAKTNKTPSQYWTYGYPIQQIGMEKDIVVVGWVSDKEKRIGMYGWLYFNRIAQYPKKNYNSFAGFKYQTPNYEFPWGDLNTNFEELFDILDGR